MLLPIHIYFYPCRVSINNYTIILYMDSYVTLKFLFKEML